VFEDSQCEQVNDGYVEACDREGEVAYPNDDHSAPNLRLRHEKDVDEHHAAHATCALNGARPAQLLNTMPSLCKLQDKAWI